MEEYLVRGRTRIEDLWLKGTDYDRQTVIDAMKENKMLHLDMDFTDECDLGCFYCDRTPDRFSKESKRKMTTEDRKRLILEAKELGAETVEFPGAGEPMQDSGFWEIVEFVHENGMIPVLFTAGHRIKTDEDIDRLYRNGVSIFLKYSTFPSHINDKYVDFEGYTDHAKDVLYKLIDKGFNKDIPTRLAVDMIVTNKHSFEEVGNVHRFCRDNNLHSYISHLIPEGRSDKKGRRKEAQRSDELINYIAEIDKAEYNLEYEPSRPMVGGYRCRQVNIGMFVNLYGQVYDCNGLGRPFSNVLESSLKDIWNSELARRIRRPEQNGFCVVRERVWKGTEKQGVERKTENYTASEKLIIENQVQIPVNEITRNLKSTDTVS